VRQSGSTVGQNGRPMAEVSTQAARLLAWFDRHARELPWRGTRDPYSIWVSEIMLQQTRVDVVTRYYARFLERFPTIASLAKAPEEEVLATWSGLGYYRRARMLHSAARKLASEGRAVPETAAGLRELPGIGGYTAAAIASIAFGEPTPVLDGNVERVTARLVSEEGQPKATATKARLLEVARSLLVETRAGDSNQALMELGATVCLPRAPRCHECPLSGGCRAFAAGRPEEYPRLAARSPPVRIRAAALLVGSGDRVLLRRRADGEAFLPGTWEPPWEPVSDEGLLNVAFAAQLGLCVREKLGALRHTITFRRLEVTVFRGSLEPLGAAVAERPGLRFVSPSELSALPTSALARKILAFGP
jgi:A/G-specific adenine glycosylase